MIVILRIGHRPQRDKRITTHVGLVARAFGADAIWISGEDRKIEESLRGMVEQWGGDFKVRSGVDWRKELKRWKSTKVHLTMYGQELGEAIDEIPKGDLMIIVGAEKVPRDVYDKADFNVSVGNQPHSEVAALAIFMDRYTEGGWLEKDFGGETVVIPTKRGKRVVNRGEGE